MFETHVAYTRNFELTFLRMVHLVIKPDPRQKLSSWRSTKWAYDFLSLFCRHESKTAATKEKKFESRQLSIVIYTHLL